MERERCQRGRTAWMALLLILALLGMGMGGFGDTEVVTRIPKPERSFLVELIDAEDVSFVLRDFSMDGLTLIPVTAGKAEVSLDFAEILEARFYLQDDRVLARVTFQNQSSRDFHADPNMPFYGITEWGKLKILSRDVRGITFLGRADGPAPPGTETD